MRKNEEEHQKLGQMRSWEEPWEPYRLVDFIWMLPVNFIFFTLSPLPHPSPIFWKVGSTGLLCKKAKKHPVLYDQKNERYREKNIVSNLWNVGKKDLELTKNDNRKLILLFMLYLGKWIFQALKKIERFALFTRNNNREGYVEPTIMGKIFGTK